MIDSDAVPFGQALDQAALSCNKGVLLGVAQKRAYFLALRSYALADVRGALEAHVVDPDHGQFMARPADIVRQIRKLVADDGRPGADEAWATALLGRDQERTVIWTTETQNAWHAAKPVLEAGDEIGARLAFRGVYERLVAEARAARVPPRWTVSEGFDVQLRDRVVTAAVQQGLLPRTELERIAPPDSHLLQLPVNERSDVPAKARESLDRLKRLMLEKNEGPGRDAQDRERTRRLQAEAAERVRQYTAGARSPNVGNPESPE